MSTDKSTKEPEPTFTVMALGLKHTKQGHQSVGLTKAEAVAEQEKLRTSGEFRRVWIQQEKS